MESTRANIVHPMTETDSLVQGETHCCGVSWKAVIAGAFVSASVALILISLGMGLGFSVISPWANRGVSAASIGIGTIVWLILTQAIAPSMGAYLAGRLRKKWAGVHTDETFFRDTAHGFLVWAVSLIISFLLFASIASSLIGGAFKVGSMAAATTAGATLAHMPPDSHPSPYLVDSLFRSTKPTTNPDMSSTKAEVTRILVNGIKQKELPPADKTYLKNVIANQLGISQAEAEERINEVMNQAQQAMVEGQKMADTARKTAAHLSLWTFIALLIGAFCASYAATIGGRQRDNCKHTVCGNN